MLAVGDPQGCPDQALVENLAYNTGGSWNLLPVGNSTPPGAEVCSVIGSDGTVVSVFSDANTGQVVCGGLEQAGWVPAPAG